MTIRQHRSFGRQASHRAISSLSSTSMFAAASGASAARLFSCRHHASLARLWASPTFLSAARSKILPRGKSREPRNHSSNKSIRGS